MRGIVKRGRDEVHLNSVRFGFSSITLFLCSVAALRAQTVSITSATPNPVAPGQTLVVSISTSGGAAGCVLTMLPYGRGNQPSVVTDNIPPMEARVAIPATLPLGYYVLEVNCNSVPSGKYVGQSEISKWVGTSLNVIVGGAPTVTGFGLSPSAPGKTLTVRGTNFGQTQGQSYVHLVGAGVPDIYITNTMTSWSNTSVAFPVPEYASSGNYQIEVQTGYGTSAPVGGLTIGPAISGWVDLHAHPMSYLGFGGKLIYGALDVGSMLPPESPPPTASCGSGSPAQTEQQALGQENLVHGTYELFDNPCGDLIRYQVIQGIETPTLPASCSPPTQPPAPGCYLPANYTDATYTTSGYQGPNPTPPDFSTWPAWNDLVDQRMWVNWMQRAYDGGQRVMVALAVNNLLLGDMTRGPGDLADDDKASGDLQITQMQAFVGRHSNFMQIAESSSDVYNIVSQNKMAVILGVELDNIGDLGVTASRKQGAPTIPTAQDLVAEVDRLYGEGVRYIFPIHLVDNPIGGSAIYNPLFDYANEWEQGPAYAIQCSQPADDIGIVLNTAVPREVQLAQAAKLFQVLPTPSSLRCTTPGTGNMNTKGLTSAGIAAIQEMMKNHMLIDIDHMSQLSANASISLAQQNSGYKYPLFSGHNGVRVFSSGINQGSSERSLTAVQYQEIGQLHGMAGVGSAQLSADKWLANYQQVIQAMGPGAVAGFGTDMDGMEFGMPPRCSALSSNGQCPNPVSSVQYGTGTLPSCPAITLLPISTEGNATWNYNNVGVAHYGMLPDFLQDVASLSGGCAIVGSMNSGAQYFYETWRIAEGNASALAPSPPPAPASLAPPAAGACPSNQVANFSGYGDFYNLGAPCICPPPSKLLASGACSTSTGSSTGTTGTGEQNDGVSCPSECKYGCSAQRICNGPPLQAKPSN